MTRNRYIVYLYQQTKNRRKYESELRHRTSGAQHLPTCTLILHRPITSFGYVSFKFYPINTLRFINSPTSNPSCTHTLSLSLKFLPFLSTQKHLIMASQELKHRTKPEEQEGETKEIDASSAADMNNSGKPRRQKKRAMASRGLRSLVLAVSFPTLLTIMDIYLFGSSNRYRNTEKPFYFPPLWALHLACLAAAFLSGLSAWLVWAEGGFHKQPNALLLYLGQLGLSLGWYPIVFGAGATRVGLVMCTALFGAMVGCCRMFRVVNPIAGDLVKPCLIWALLLSIVNLRLVYH